MQANVHRHRTILQDALDVPELLGSLPDSPAVVPAPASQANAADYGQHAQLTCKGRLHGDLCIADMVSIAPDTPPEAIPNVSPIEGGYLPAIVKVAFAARRTDTKVGVGTLHRLSKHLRVRLIASDPLKGALKIATSAIASNQTLQTQVAGPTECCHPARITGHLYRSSKSASESEMDINKRHTPTLHKLRRHHNLGPSNPQ